MESKRQMQKGPVKKQGPRALVWNEFKRSGQIDKAYEEVVKVYGEKSFKKELICKWIKEEMQKIEETRKCETSRENDNDEAR